MHQSLTTARCDHKFINNLIPMIKSVLRNVFKMGIYRIDKGKNKTNSNNDIDDGEDFTPISLR